MLFMQTLDAEFRLHLQPCARCASLQTIILWHEPLEQWLRDRLQLSPHMDILIPTYRLV
jgi:hypothetical protein